MKSVDQACEQRLAEIAKKHSSEAFYALDDPLEAVVFSVLVAGLDFDLLGHFSACIDPVALEGAEDGSEAALLGLEAALQGLYHLSMGGRILEVHVE